MADIKIVNYSPEWEEAHQLFANEYFKGKRKRINPDYIYWKFRGTERAELKSFILAVKEQEVIGQIGLIPAQVKLGNDLFDAQWICEIMVNDNYRGQGIAKLLYEEGLKRKTTLGSDASPSAAKSLARSGFKQIEGPWKLFFPIILSSITDKKVKKLSPIFRVIKHPSVWLIQLASFFGKFTLTDYKIDKSHVDYQWLEKMLKPNYAYINRDDNFYSWRMSAFKDYQNEGEFYQKKESFFLTLRVSDKLALVGDFVYKDNKTATSVIKTLLLEMNSRGIYEVKINTHDQDLIAALKRVGFLKYSTKTDIIYCSHDESFNIKIESYNRFEYTNIDSDENI